jgi:hypothetical protein
MYAKGVAASGGAAPGHEHGAPQGGEGASSGAGPGKGAPAEGGGSGGTVDAEYTVVDEDK